MQTRDNLERMVVIKAFIAVRVLGLRQGGISEETQNDSCEKILTPTEWKLLWVKLEGKPLPSQTPTLKWACLKLAKLGRWHDSKRTGRPGWVVMWDGWFRLLNRPGFPGEYFICELRLPDHRFRWKHNKLFLLLPEEYGPAFPAIVDCYTSPPT